MSRTGSSSKHLAKLALAALAAISALSLTAPTGAGAAPPPCRTAALVVWSNNGAGGGTAGSVFYKLRFTNLSGHACTLRGFPKVAAVDLAGRRVGAVARHAAGSKAKTVRLADGATATATLQVVDAGNFTPSSCDPVTAAGLRVTPPGQSRSKLVPLPFETCADAGQPTLTIGVVG